MPRIFFLNNILKRAQPTHFFNETAFFFNLKKTENIWWARSRKARLFYIHRCVKTYCSLLGFNQASLKQVMNLLNGFFWPACRADKLPKRKEGIGYSLLKHSQSISFSLVLNRQKVSSPWNSQKIVDSTACLNCDSNEQPHSTKLHPNQLQSSRNAITLFKTLPNRYKNLDGHFPLVVNQLSKRHLNSRL